MLRTLRAGLALAAAVLLLPVAPLAAATGANPAPELIEDLETWLDRHSPWPRRNPAPTIRLHHAPQGAGDVRANFWGGVPRGTYNPETFEITLFAPWSADDPHDVSVLLHELAHHRQQTARHWYCPGAQERPAYELQARWLAERGLTARINWIAATLESGCSPRDIHPD